MPPRLTPEQRQDVAEQIITGERLAEVQFPVVQKYVEIASANNDAILAANEPQGAEAAKALAEKLK